MKKVITDPAVMDAKKKILKAYENYNIFFHNTPNVKEFGRTKVLQAKRKKK